MSKEKIIKRMVRSVGIKVFNCVFRNRKIANNKVFFLNFSNRYECNPKYICEQFLKENGGYDLVFATNKQTNIEGMYPKEVRVVRRGTAEFYKELYSSKVIVDNDITLAFVGFRKKKGQYVFQTFHGSLGIKAFGRDANDDKAWHKKADKSAAMTDFIISNSNFEDNIYKSTFWAKTPILQYGHARNDILFVDDKQKSVIKTKICKKYGVNLDSKICLYAPTFRDVEDKNIFKLSFDSLKQSLSQKFSGNWVVFVRFHTVTTHLLGNEELPNNVVDVTDYPDVQELAAVIDCGITDYSSWICEYLLRRKPGFIYAPDYLNYQKNERPLTIPLEKLPFPLATSTDELNEQITKFDEKAYKTRCEEFLKFHGSVDDGRASERIVNKTKEYLK